MYNFLQNLIQKYELLFLTCVVNWYQSHAWPVSVLDTFEYHRVIRLINEQWNFRAKDNSVNIQIIKKITKNKMKLMRHIHVHTAVTKQAIRENRTKLQNKTNENNIPGAGFTNHG